MALSKAEITERYRVRHPDRVTESKRLFKLRHPERAHEHYVAYQRAYMQKRRSLAQAFIDAAHADGCVDCGNKNLAVLESDHVRGDKVACVTELLNGSLANLFAELDKCETRCANCHAIVTAARRKVA